MMKKTKLYTCPECDLSYKEKELAKKCEAWCKKHNSCNLEITKHSINKQSFSTNKMAHQTKRTAPKTDFSKFFVLEKTESKKKLLKEVVKKANEDQKRLFQSA